MKIARQIDLVNRAVAIVRASIPPDPLAGLTVRERDAVQRYRRTVEPAQQWIDATDGKDLTTALITAAGLSADCSEQDAQDIYQRARETRSNLRQALKGFKRNDQ